jgi:carboxymethylenebutenolidase
MNNLAPYQQTMLATWQQHTYAEFVLKDADAALATMTENPYVLAIPSGTGGLEMAWMLPGVRATGRRVELALVGIIQFDAGKVAHEHLYWDQATVLSQLGVLDHPAAAAGVGSAARLLKLR